ncbi:MAG TPA: type II secretion system protein GspG [Pyrinomonadaceae bacterium]|nr:type II secretion system protein GspG [Pyrinomonadaceae bacterium]
MKQGDARKAIAAAPGFALRESAVVVRGVSAEGVAPVEVAADVTVGVRLARVEDERAEQDSMLFRRKRWRAVEFRTGDRSWEEFDFAASVFGAEAVEPARAAVEELVAEFEARLRESKGRPVEPLSRGALTVRQLTALGSSVVAELGVAATFRLARPARGRWRVNEILLGDFTTGDLEAAWRRADAVKAERARADLETVRAALERFRGERGFYVISDSEVVLMDHLNPAYVERVIRLDPWLRPYRYAGTRDRFTLSSNGPDGKPGTPDDLTLSR